MKGKIQGRRSRKEGPKNGLRKRKGEEKKEGRARFKYREEEGKKEGRER